MRIRFLASMGALAAAAFGCGLISSDITKVTFALPPRTYLVDTGALNLPVTGSIPPIPCGDGPAMLADCCNPPPPAPKPDCDATPIICSDAGVCTARLKVSQSQEINLGQEAPQLRNAPSFGNLTIASIGYDVEENSLNVDLPPLTLFLAPDNVTDWMDKDAREFGTIPAIPAGKKVMGNVQLVDGAEGIFAGFASDLSKPFTFIGTTTIDVPSGSSVPTGRISVKVTGTMSASL